MTYYESYKELNTAEAIKRKAKKDRAIVALYLDNNPDRLKAIEDAMNKALKEVENGMDICGDNRFEIIAKAKADLLEATNIEASPDEMKVLDNFLYRCWQMGWLDMYKAEEGNFRIRQTDLIRRSDAIKAIYEEFDTQVTAFSKIENAVISIPSVEPKKGEWVSAFDGNEQYCYCSNCKEQWYEEDLLMGDNEFPSFCPNCGARMK